MIEKFTFNTSEGSCLSTPNQTQSGGQFEQNSSFMEILLGNCSLSNFCDLSGTHIFDSFETPWCAEVQYSCIDLSKYIYDLLTQTVPEWLPGLE